MPPSSSIDALEFRKALGTFVTGVTVVTALAPDGEPRGMTANSFASVSLDPPLVSICIGKSAGSYEVFAGASAFAVNILHDKQSAVSSTFASKVANKFEAIAYDRVHTGAPVLSDCLTWFDCVVHDRVDAGDHQILIGCVQAFGTSPAAPLGFCRGRYANVSDPLPSGWFASQHMLIAYLIESDGRILLRSDGKGGYSLPSGSTKRADHQIMLGNGRAIGVVHEKTFLYSIFDVADGESGHLVYRASLAAGMAEDLPDGPELRFFAMDDLPYDSIASREVRAVLRRYANERNGGRFGIYMDSVGGGRVAMLEAELGV